MHAYGKAEQEGDELKKAMREGKNTKKSGELEKLVDDAQPILGPNC